MDWEAAETILMKRLTDQSRKHEGNRHGDPLCVYGAQLEMTLLSGSGLGSSST